MTTNNFFQNNLPENLMVVSGETTQTSYIAKNFSDKRSNVIKVVFNDPHRGNFRTAYDPTNLNTSGQKTFRPEIFSSDYEVKKHFRVKQIDGLTGKVSAEGIPLRWVPGSNENGGGTLFIEVLFHNTEPSSVFNPENGVIFCNEPLGFEYEGNSYPGNPMWAGAAIRSITDLSNVYKITTDEPLNTVSSNINCNNVLTPVGRGSFEFSQRVLLKTNQAAVCTSEVAATGTVIAQSIDTSSNKLAIFVQFDQVLSSSTLSNASNGYICLGNGENNCIGSCCIYGVSTISQVDTPTCGTVQKIVFSDENNAFYLPDYEVYQWKWEEAGNHPSNIPHIESGSDDVYKISGTYLNWDPISKTLIVLAPTKRFELKYGNVYQKQGEALISRGSAINSTASRFERKSGSFVNLKNTPLTPTYAVGQEYYQGWPTSATGTSIGENLIQVTQSGETSYNSNYEYVVGETVVQLLSQSGNSFEYAAGRVVAWEPNKTALSTIPSKLVIKRFEYGTDSPFNINTNNPLITKNKPLARFRIGSSILPPVDTTLTSRSKRNILPFRIFQTLNVVGSTASIAWYSFASPTVKQYSLTTKIPFDPSLPGTNNIGELVKGSAIGTSRIKAIQYYSSNLHKIHLMDSNIDFTNSSFADCSNIGVYGTKTENQITYPVIYPLIDVLQENIDGVKYTTLYEPLKDKMITVLPGSDVFENVASGVSNFGQTELLLQKIYNVEFKTNNTQEIQIGSTIPSAEFLSELSSSYSFAVDEKGNSIRLIKFAGLEQTNENFVQPIDESSVYYDVLQSGGAQSPRNKIIFRKKSNGFDQLTVGAVIKCVVSSVVKNKSNRQFTTNGRLRYNNTGEFAGKWTAEIDAYDVSDLISVFFKGSGTTLLSNNKVDLFGFANQTNDYVYKKTIVVLGQEGLKQNTNTDITAGPISPEIPTFGVFTQDSANATDYYVEILVTGIDKSVSESTGGIVLRESYKDFNNTILPVREIPFYTSRVDGKEYHASGILDCRPVVNKNNTVGNTKFVVLPSSSTINTTLGVYLPRKDILYINKDGAFKIVYGEESATPSYPILPEFGMILYKIDKPSYIFTYKDLSLSYTDNRRYTMRDIGRIEKRVQQLEIYSALSLLEKDADSLLIEDAEGNNRFKNGIIVDPFDNHKLGDIVHPDYNVSIDTTKKALRPKFSNTPVSLLYEPTTGANQFIEIMNSKTGLSGSQENGPISTGLYMMPFTETPFVVQPQATRSMTVTPFEVIVSEGILRLAPREDDWVDTATLPEINVNLAGNNDIWEDIVDELNASPTGPFGLDFGNWQTFSSQTTRERGVVVNGAFTSQSNGNFIRTTNQINEARQITGSLLNTSTETVSLGERVVDVSIIPYLRAKRIRIVSTGMKSNSRMYPFFDGIDVSQHCYAYDNMTELENAFITGELNSNNRFTTNIKKTNAEGSAFILFDLPAGTFRTGDRKFSLSDHPNNDLTRASTFAGGTYSAYGLSQVRQATNATVRNFDVETIDRTEDRVRSEVAITRIPRRDPLAQTFEINRELYPDGIFLSSIDLFFARKPDNSTNIPVTVEVRPTINGFPDINKIHSGGICILHPKQVNVSDFPSATNADTITRFVFEHPVYLEPGEHSFVVKSTTEEYEVYIAELGQTLVNSTQRVTEQPYVGVFFTSSNASTWLPQPGMDIMMTMNKCEFQTNTAHTLTVKTASVGKALEYELLNFSNAYQAFSTAQISWSMGPTLNSIATNFNANENIIYNTTQTLLDGENLYFQATGITTNKDISPVINMERMSLFVVKNLIENNNNLETNTELNSYASELNKSRARYITKIINLEQGFESSGFKLILAVNKPAGTKIQAFLKYQPIEQTTNFHQNSYIQLVPKMGLSEFDAYSTQFEDQFVDVEFDLPQSNSVEFNRFAVKICLYSDNAASIPQVKDLRGVAVL
jgi:hypothetical protein